MAARVNTRFIILLVAICGVAAIALLAVAFLYMRSNPYINISRGDKLMAEGEYRLAMREYGRACNKAPSDLEFLAKFEDAILQIKPENLYEAQEFYGWLRNVLAIRVQNRQTDAGFNIALLEELYKVARLSPSMQIWEDISDASANTRVPSTDDAYPRIVALGLYAESQRKELLSPEELKELENRFAQFVTEHPDNGLAQAEYARLLLERSERLQFARNSVEADVYLKKGREVLEAANKLNPDSIEVALLVGRIAANDLATNVEEATREKVNIEVDRIVRLIRGEDNPLILNQVVALLPRIALKKGIDESTSLMQEYLDRNPDDLIVRWQLSSLYFDTGQYDLSAEAAELILNSEPRSVDFIALYRFILRQWAAKRIFDVEFIRRQDVSESEYAAQMEKTIQTRDRLAELVPNIETDVLLAECDGWLAIADGNFLVAATKFNYVVEQSSRPDARTLMGAAFAYEKQNAPGPALECIQNALEQMPWSMELLNSAAKLELQMGMYEHAIAHTNRALKLDENDTRAQIMKARAERLLAGEQPGEDPVTKVLVEAEQAINEGDYGAARSMLLVAIEQYPTNYGILHALVIAELQGGFQDEARRRVEEKVKEYPNDENLRKLLAVVRGEDPIDTLRGIVELRFSDENARTVAMFTGLRQMAGNKIREAKQLRDEGAAADADKAVADAQHYNALALDFRRQVEKNTPDDPSFLDQIFRDALAENDYDTAREITDKAKSINADQANGLFYQARLELAQEDYRSAVYTLQDATAAKPFSVWVWRALGSVYLRLGNVADATLAYQTAIEQQPNDTLTIRLFAEMLANSGDHERALNLLRNATSQYQNRSDAQLLELWLNVEAKYGDVVIAINERRELYKINPEDVRIAVNLATLLGNAISTRESIVDLGGEAKFSEREWIVLRQADRDKYLSEQREKWIAEADAIFNSLAAVNKDNLGFVNALANFYKDTGRVEQGFSELNNYIKRHSASERNSTMFIVLSQYLINIKRHSDAVNVLKQGIEYQTDETREVDLALGQLYFSFNQYEQAYSHLLRVGERNKSQMVTYMLAECEISMGQLTESESRLATFEQESGTTYEIELLKARIARGRARDLFAQGKNVEADRQVREQRLAIDRSIELLPSRPQAYVMKARSIFDDFLKSDPKRYTLLDDANSEISRALDRHAGFIPAIRLRSQMLLSKNPPDYQGAIGELSVLLQINSRDDTIRRTIINLNVESGAVQRAIEVAKEGTLAIPDNAVWFSVTGQLYEMRGENTDAAQWYDRGYAINKGNTMLRRWATAMLATGEQPAAQQVIVRLEENPSVMETMPALQCLYGRALFAVGEIEDAIIQISEAYGEYKSAAETQENPWLVDDWFAYLKQIPLSAGQLEKLLAELTNNNPTVAETTGLAESLKNAEVGSSRAIELYNNVLEVLDEKDTENRIRVLIGMGENYWLLGTYGPAKDAFDRAVKLDPQNPAARNGIAFVLAAGLDRAEEALEHALKAVEIAADNSSYLDTLGTVYIKLERYREAEDALQKSINQRVSASNHLHMAQVMVARNRIPRARQLLASAKQMNSDPQTQAEIDRLLTDISQ